MDVMDWDDLFPQHAKIIGRVVAVGYCPHCGPAQSVTITQPVLEWLDEKQTQPEMYGQLEMQCQICGATMADVELPLDEAKWQLLIRPKVSSRFAKVVSMPATRRAAAR